MDPQEKKKVLNTSELIVKCLEREGVKYIFGIPGEENLTFLRALRNSGIRFITTRHEQGAAFMADVCGRLTGFPGVCLSTLGPGATNLMTGVADAFIDGSPVIALTGQAGTDRMHIETHQYLDLVSMFEPVTKWSQQIVRPDTAPEVIRRAFKLAVSEKPGAVHIDLPENIAAMPADGAPLSHGDKEKTLAGYGSIRRAVDAINHARRPVIIAGNGVVRSRASQALTFMVDKLQIPVSNTFMAKGVVSYKNPLSLWTIGMAQKDYVNHIFEQADLVLAIGYDIVEYAPKRWNADDRLKIIHIGEQKAEINKYYIPEVEVVGDISNSLYEIGKRCKTFDPQGFVKTVREEMEQNYLSYSADASFPMKPQKVLYDLRQILGPDDIVLSDVGAHKMWIARHYKCENPNTCLISNGFASMGFSIPGAIAAKLVNPGKTVVAVTGDGGFLMNSQEIETSMREKIPIVILIFNDSSYGLIKWKQMDRYGQDMYVNFTNPDFLMYARSFGAKGYRVEKAGDLEQILQDAKKQQVTSVIDCRVDYSENVKLSRELKKMEIPEPEPSVARVKSLCR